VESIMYENWLTEKHKGYLYLFAFFPISFRDSPTDYTAILKFPY
jgi:hypothetical protein